MSALFQWLWNWSASPAVGDWARLLAGCGLSWLGQTALLLAPGLWLLRVLRRRPSSARNLIGRALLVTTLLLIGLSLGARGRVNSLWNVSLPAATTTSAESVSASNLTRFREAPTPDLGSSSAAPPMQFESPLPQSSASPRAETPIETAPAISHFNHRFVVAAVAIWLSGALISLIWMVLCHVFLAKMRREAAPVRDLEALQVLQQVCARWNVRAPLLLLHPAAGSPFLTGWFRPAIVLPAMETPLEGEALCAVFNLLGQFPAACCGFVRSRSHLLSAQAPLHPQKPQRLDLALSPGVPGQVSPCGF